MKEQFSVIGKTVPKIDGRAKATGEAQYSYDLKFPNMLYGKILTSPHAHARILRIDTSEAEKLPGVKAVITHKDVPSKKYGLSPARWDENIFCIDKVRHVGDKVAAVAAIDEETVYKALKLIKVDYEELPAVFHPMEAMQEGAPLIHEDWPRNISVEIHQEFGDVGAALKQAHHVRTDTFLGHRTFHAPIEPHCTTAIWDNGKLTLWANNHSPAYLQYYVARQFDLSMSDVRVIPPRIGGSFGAKGEPIGMDFIAPVLARVTGRPVKMWNDRADIFGHNRGRCRQIMELTTGVDAEGKILGVHANFVMDGGAYACLGIATAYYAGALLTLTYDYPNYKFDQFRVYTNLPASAAQRGHGAPHPRWALESHLDRIAEDLNMDPVDLRLKNLRKPNSMTPNAFKVNTCELQACIEEARKATGWNEKKGKLGELRGIGMGLGAWVSGAGFPIYRTDLPQSVAYIKVDEHGGCATLFTGATDVGQGSDTVFCQMAAEGMGYKYEDMRIVSGDTMGSTHDFGAYSSRQTLMSGWAVKRAGEDVKAKVLEMAGEMMGVDPSKLDAREGVVFVKDDQTVNKPYAEVARTYLVKKGLLIGRGYYKPEKFGGDFKGAPVGTSPAYSFAAQTVEVEVDGETGQIDLKEVWDVHDSGTLINPGLVDGQVHGALMMGLGEAIWEQLVYDEKGVPLGPNLAEYRIPTALDLPMFNCKIVDSADPDPGGPWGVKEVGEGALVPTEGTVANALLDATGIHFDSLPLTPEKVWRALREKEQASGK